MTDSSDQNKSATPEQTQAGPQPFPYSPTGYPLPGTYPPFFAYPPPQSDSESSGSTLAPQYMMIPPPPPGMIYAFPPPPPGQPFPIPQVAPTSATPAAPAAPARPKRKQVKMACTNCATACKRCDEARPCERCLKYGIADTCVDSQRKERKKGIKRGPYKRKNKSVGDFSEFTASEGSDWPNAQSAATPGTTTVHAVPPFAAPEGYYPVYYPPFALSVPEGQPGQDGAVQNGHPHPVVPYYFPPYYPHPYGLVPQPPVPGTQPQADSSKRSEDRTTADGSQNKVRMTKKEPRAKDNEAEMDDSDTPAA